MAIDQAKLDALLGRAVVDIGANFHAALVVTGDKLGLFRALRDLGPTTAADLAKRTGTHERYVREWLSAMAAGGYVTYEAPPSGSPYRKSRPSPSSTPTCRARSCSRRPP